MSSMWYLFPCPSCRLKCVDMASSAFSYSVSSIIMPSASTR